MSRFLRLTAGLSAGLGLVLALPGLLLLLGSAQISSLLVDREQRARDASLDAIDSTPESELR